MRKWLLASALAFVPAVLWAADAPPEWAYPTAPPDYQPPPEGNQPVRVAGSERTYTPAQIGDGNNPPDWFPDEHPPMPDIVAHGKPGAVNGCAQCHLTSGAGHPESANIAGLPAGYIVEQLREFQNGNRRSSVAGRSASMIRFAKAMSEEDMQQAADYFASLKRGVWNIVVETDEVPKTYVGEGNMRFAHEGEEMEPIGNRIIELPQNEEGARARDPHSPFVAYVPRGSVRKGEMLAKTGGDGTTIQCGVCHGGDFKGIGNVPGLAGRSPIYIFRQLYDIQHGTRMGNAVALMQPVVQKLTQDDMLALAAYMGSLTP